MLTTLGIYCDNKMMMMFFDIIDSYNIMLDSLVNECKEFIDNEPAYAKFRRGYQRSRVLNIEEDIKAEDERNKAGA
jgi:hypothetical protein